MGSSGRLLTSADILDGSIMNVDINAAAGITTGKLAHLGAGNVFRSNGTANVGGQIVNGDIAPNTISGDSKLVNSSITGNAAGSAIGVDALHANRIMDGQFDYTQFQRIVGTGAMHPNRLLPGGFDQAQVNAAFAGQSINGSRLVDNTVDYSDIVVASAVNYNTGFPSTSPSTSSTTPVYMAEMTVQLTTIGRPVLVLFNGSFYHDQAGQMVRVHLYKDGVDQGMGRQLSNPNTNYHSTLSFLYCVTPAVGTHNYQIYWSTTSGTMTCYSSWRMLIAMELRR